MPAEKNTILSSDIQSQVREVQFTLRFENNIKKLIEALGITRKIKKEAGTMLKSYVVSGTLEDGKVAEGETIPLSKYTVKPKNYKPITLNKWRKQTTVEAIIEKGFKAAVTDTTSKMINDVQMGIRKSFFAFLATGSTKVTGTGLQAALAKGWGKLQVLFEDDTIESVYFVNPEDIADYLADAAITTQTAFGMKYIEDFLGLGTVFMNSSVPKGTYYATAKENLVLYYIATNDSNIGEAFSFTTDETGLIGIHEQSDYTNLTAYNTVVSGIEIFAENLAGVVVGTISPVLPASEGVPAA